MQPTRRHVPPSSGSLSMQTDLAPSWAARIAAVYPPGPPPRTATSHSIVLSLPQSISSVDPTGVPMGTALSAIGWDTSGGCHRPRPRQTMGPPNHAAVLGRASHGRWLPPDMADRRGILRTG